MRNSTLCIFIGVILTVFYVGYTEPKKENRTRFTPIYYSNIVAKEDLDNIQCPIPHENRVLNRTQTQCVWASIEMLGRWAEEPKLINLTNRKECQSYSSPDEVVPVLRKLNVRFEQSWQNRLKGLQLIKKSMKEGRGCLWAIPGHAMVLIHYDENNNIFKWVDNCDINLAIQTGTIDKFNKMWDSWVLVIYADNDIIARKLSKRIQIPIIDADGVKREYDWDYVPEANHSIPIPFLKRKI